MVIIIDPKKKLLDLIVCATLFCRPAGEAKQEGKHNEEISDFLWICDLILSGWTDINLYFTSKIRDKNI